MEDGMSKVYFTSDLHLAHKNITKYRPRFSSQEQHDEYMFILLESLTKHDKLFVLGDFLFNDDILTDKYLERISRLPCRITLILGNHDDNELYKKLPSNVTLQLPLCNYKAFWLSHCPIHPQEMRRRLGNIHGHLHDEVLNDKRYFNVNVDVNDYKLVELSTILNHFSKKDLQWFLKPYIKKLKQVRYKVTKYLSTNTRIQYFKDRLMVRSRST